MRTSPLITLKGDAWEQAGTLKAEDSYLPVGADFDAAGRLYVLERDYSLISFQSRVRRITNPGRASQRVETIFESEMGEFENLEAITVTGDQHHLLLIADGNRMPFQETQAILIRIKPELRANITPTTVKIANGT